MYMSLLISVEPVPLQVKTKNVFVLPVSIVTRVNKMVSIICCKSCYSFLSTFCIIVCNFVVDATCFIYIKCKCW
jgi:hypothetical protein